MSSSYGENIRVTVFGQSHSPAVGVTIEGIPAGEALDLEALQRFLDRRAPGRNAWSTPRRESDVPEFVSGLLDGVTCGAPLTALLRNADTRWPVCRAPATRITPRRSSTAGIRTLPAADTFPDA